MVSVWSMTDNEYVLLKIQINTCMNVNLDGYRWSYDDGVNLCRWILDWIGTKLIIIMNMDLRNL